MSRKERIEQQLTKELAPSFLQVDDESSHHHVPKDAQTHFKIIAVSEKFTKLSRIARHRLVNHLLSKEFKQGLHALSLQLYTTKEWPNQSICSSPACKDGYEK